MGDLHKHSFDVASYDKVSSMRFVLLARGDTNYPASIDRKKHVIVTEFAFQ